MAGWEARIAEAGAAPPSWVRDADRRIPVVSITGTNGKSTVTRLITHILLLAGHHVGTTTSDGILVDERMVEAGDWTGPGGAAAILRRDDVDMAVLETARGGLVLRGMGYESNEASVFTNVSSDHLDLQGIHTLPELAEVKATVCRVTKPGGLVVLNADDPLVAAWRGGCTRASPTSRWTRAPRRSLRATGGRAGSPGCSTGPAGRMGRRRGASRCSTSRTCRSRSAAWRGTTSRMRWRRPAGRGRWARPGSRSRTGCGTSARRRTCRRAGCNLFRLGRRTVIVDFAHNEAGTEAILDVAAAIAGGAAGRVGAR